MQGMVADPSRALVVGHDAPRQVAFLYCMQVCVAGLCIKQKDLLHAGYLAITLLFFRQRYLLMTAPAAQQGIAVRGARLFAWLPAFNLVVMTLTLLYQVGCRFCSHPAVFVGVFAHMQRAI